MRRRNPPSRLPPYMTLGSCQTTTRTPTQSSGYSEPVISSKAPNCGRRWCEAVFKNWSRDQRRVVAEALRLYGGLLLLTDVTLPGTPGYEKHRSGVALPWADEHRSRLRFDRAAHCRRGRAVCTGARGRHIRVTAGRRSSDRERQRFRHRHRQSTGRSALTTAVRKISTELRSGAGIRRDS